MFWEIASELPTTSDEMESRIKSPINPDDFERQFKEIIRRRIHHREKNCLNNLAEAQTCNDGQTIVWTGGHFAIPVHKELNEALERMPHAWIRLVWQQIIRQMYEDAVKDEMLFRIATEALLVL